MIEIAMLAVGFFFGIIIGYIICGIKLGERIILLEDELMRMTDRDEKGRFVGSMGKFN
jgi:hypothetical protein